jgi:hypothetical protein
MLRSAIVILCLFVVAPHALAEGLGFKPFLTAYDANGNKIGTVHGIAAFGQVSHATVVFQVDERAYTLSLDKNLLYGTSLPYYETEDCSGTPYVVADAALIPNTLVLDPDRTLYIPDPNFPDEKIIIKSFRTGALECIRTLSSELLVHRTVLWVKLNDFFTPPFSVR